jgi:hypothetical protein
MTLGTYKEPKGESTMNLAIWLLGLFLLGLVGMGLIFAFVVACDRV